jgi:hypothetical protein
MVSVELVPAQTLPKFPAPLVVILPGSAVPVTFTLMLPPLLGLLLATVMIPFLVPKLSGWNLTGAATELPC